MGMVGWDVDEGRAGAGEDGSEQLGAVQEQLGAVQRQLSVGNTLAKRELILEAIALHRRYREITYTVHCVWVS